jgi:putative Holliday junction resolvase
MRSGRRLAIDAGKARVGLAISDLNGILASGLATVARKPELADTATQILKSLEEHEIEPADILEIYVGLPTNLKGLETESTRDALLLAKAISELFAAPVRLIDERLSTVSATSALRSSGISSKAGRSVIDQVAATVILEQALAIERASGNPPGKPLSEFESSHE